MERDDIERNTKDALELGWTAAEKPRPGVPADDDELVGDDELDADEPADSEADDEDEGDDEAQAETDEDVLPGDRFDEPEEDEPDEAPVLVRLNKYLADHGVASRRRCDELIQKGQVTVDGETVTELGLKVDPSKQTVEIDGFVLKPTGLRRRYYLLNKPSGVVCTNEARELRPRAVDLITDPRKGRIYTVGRLDEESKGLIILTNDGDFAQKIMHPRHGMEKTYLVRVAGKIDDAALQKIREGIHLSEGRTAGARVLVHERQRESSWLSVTIHEGMNREIRRSFARVGYKVLELKRTRIGALTDRGLKIGRWRELTRAEVVALSTRAPSAASTGPRGKKGGRPPRTFSGKAALSEAEQRLAERRAAREAREAEGEGARGGSGRPAGPRGAAARTSGGDRTRGAFGAKPWKERGGDAGPRRGGPGRPRPQAADGGEDRPSRFGAEGARRGRPGGAAARGARSGDGGPRGARFGGGGARGPRSGGDGARSTRPSGDGPRGARFAGKGARSGAGDARPRGPKGGARRGRDDGFAAPRPEGGFGPRPSGDRKGPPKRGPGGRRGAGSFPAPMRRKGGRDGGDA
ncbi:MAG: pseudouridine synthase [Planctomycetes bacterium]|nr:pseudouridine synthase [Planctomycetota bacterium]